MQRFTCWAALAALLLLPSMIALSPGATAAGRRASGGRDRPQPPRGAPAPGDPLTGLTAAEREAFEGGLAEFEEVETVEEGLGPVFNGRGCAECHAQAAVGGAGPDLTISREIRIATLRNGVFDPLVELGGMLLQQRSIQEDFPGLPLTGEIAPSEARLVSLRITTPVFGAGLIEAIPVGQVLQRADAADRDRDGISGLPNMVLNPETVAPCGSAPISTARAAPA